MTMNMTNRWFSSALIAASLIGAAARAGTTVLTTTASFDFKEQAVSSSTVTTLTASNAGVSATIDRGGQPFQIVNLSAFSGTSVFGSRSLSPTPPGMSAFTVSFSQPVSSFSAQLGDFGNGITDAMTVAAFSGPNGTGTKLRTSTANLQLLDATTFASKTLAVAAPNIESVQLIGGSPGSPNSMFYDNFAVTVAPSGGGPSAVPLPPALYTAPLAGILVLMALRRMRGPRAAW